MEPSPLTSADTLRPLAGRTTAWLIFAACLSGLWAWQAYERRLPNDDAANLAQTAMEIHNVWAEKGWTKGLAALLLHHGWRPIAMPNLTAPLVTLFNGDVATATAGFLIISWAGLFFFTYRCLRLSAGPVTSSLCAGFLAMLPAFAARAFVFYAELPMLACLVAALYHSQQCHAAGFATLRQGAWLGFWLGMAILFRPLEALSASVLLFAVLGVAGLRSRQLRLRDLAASAVLVGLSAGLLVAVAHGVPIWAGLVILSAAVGGYWWIALSRPGRMNAAIAAAATAMACLAFLWYVPRTVNLANWIWQCTFGDMIHQLKGRGELSALQALWLYTSSLGAWPLAAAAALAGVRLLSRSRPIGGVFFLIVGGAQILALVALTAMMAGSDLRRGLAGFYCLFLGLTAFAVTGGRRLAWARVAPFALMAAGELLALWIAATGRPCPPRSLAWLVPADLLSRPRRTEDENIAVFAALRRLVPTAKTICPLSLSTYAYDLRAFCPHALNLLAAQHRAAVTFGYPWNFQTVEEGNDQARRGFDFILLDTRDVPAGLPESATQSPTSRLAADLVHRLSHGTLAEAGWAVAARFNCRGVELALLEAVLPGDPQLSEEMNLASRMRGARSWATGSQTGYPSEHLNDRNASSPWGSPEGLSDVMAGVSLPKPARAGVLKIVLFSPGGKAHLRDISVLAAASPPATAKDCTLLRCRIAGSDQPFAEKVTVPAGVDSQCVTLELDPSDPKAGEYSVYGIACFRSSRKDRPNYLPVGSGVYIREMQVGRSGTGSQ